MIDFSSGISTLEYFYQMSSGAVFGYWGRYLLSAERFIVWGEAVFTSYGTQGRVLSSAVLDVVEDVEDDVLC